MTRRGRIREFLIYAVVRALAMTFEMFPIEWNLRTARRLGWCWFHFPGWAPFVGRSLSRHRRRSIRHLRRAMRHELSKADRRRITLQSMQHWAMVYLVEMVQTPRILTKWTWARYVTLCNLGPTARILLSQRGCIMLTPHFGNFEVLGYVLALLGFPITALMRPLDNPYLTDYVVERRRKSGLSLLFKRGAIAQAPDVLQRGEGLCFIADQDAGRKGLFVEFFGRPASTYKSIGLLAMRYRVPIIIGGARRIGQRFKFAIEVQRLIEPHEWEGRPDELAWVTQEFSHAMEQVIRAAPEQYLWIHRRWKSQPQPKLAGPG